MIKTKEVIQGEALEILIPCFHGTAAIGTGVGKTLIGLKHIEHHYTDYLKVLVVAPKQSIIDGWREEMEKFSLSHLESHITFSTYLSLDKQALDYDAVYLDEIHSLLYSHDEWLKNFKGKIIGFTGTIPDSEHSEKSIMIKRYAPVVYTYEIDEAIEDHILNNYEIVIHPLQLDIAKTLKVEKGEKVWYTSERASYEYWTNRIETTTGKALQIARIMRMRAIMEFPSKEKYALKLFNSIQEKIILFTNTQEQADKLCKYSYHSKNPNSEQNLAEFRDGIINKLSCVLQLNEGVNIPNLREGIIMHSFSNNVKTSQRIGRLLRLNPDDTATIHILCYQDTVDEKWVGDALKDFDSTKVSWA